MATDMEAVARTDRGLPGVEGVWVFVFADMTVFALIFASFMMDRRANPALFEASRQALNQNLGGINTLILLTSSMLVVLAVDAIKRKPRQAPLFFALALACGLAFVGLKAIEYTQKIEAGTSLLTNDFFMYYFVMTGMHLGHVVAGNVVLAVLYLKSRSVSATGSNSTLYESGATYWHMVDLLWVCLFPLLYLVR